MPAPTNPQDPPAPSDQHAAAWPAAPVEVLDACHREIVRTLQDLRALVLHVRCAGLDDATREAARRVHLFLSTVAVRHHHDEERHVFPPLLRLEDPQLTRQVLELQDQHARLEDEWLQLAPLLDAAARGHRWRDIGDIAERVDRYTALYLEHIALEETQVYPRARGLLGPDDLHRMSRDMAQRRHRLQMDEHAGESEDGDADGQA